MSIIPGNYRNLNIKKNVVIQKNKQPLILTMKCGNISVTQLNNCNAYIFSPSAVIQFASAG